MAMKKNQKTGHMVKIKNEMVLMKLRTEKEITKTVTNENTSLINL
jgi:hypothetical protein